MRVEPPRSDWRFPEPARFDPDDDLVAAGADLAPGTLLEAYRRGLFPMPSGRRGDPMLWFSPVRRGVLPLDRLRVSRSLQRSVRRFEIRVDSALPAVIEGCADPQRPAGWIDAAIRTAYVELHRLGWVHSVEAWRGDRLAGGLYGVSIGGLFAGESMFHRESDASKVALVGLVDLLREDAGEPRLLDVQWQTPHLASLGVVQVPRQEYLARLPEVIAAGVPPAFG
jgi:leucyl/phenylalanyl-tRNA---protein transferase